MDMAKLLQKLDSVAAKPAVDTNSMRKFLQVVTEAKSPHKVTLPVQMAMQHYQQPATKPQPRERLIDKYFVEAETAIMQRQEEKRAVYNQYAKTIANRVLMKEGAEGFNTAYLDIKMETFSLNAKSSLEAEDKKISFISSMIKKIKEHKLVTRS